MNGNCDKLREKIEFWVFRKKFTSNLNENYYQFLTLKEKYDRNLIVKGSRNMAGMLFCSTFFFFRVITRQMNYE